MARPLLQGAFDRHHASIFGTRREPHRDRRYTIAGTKTGPGHPPLAHRFQPGNPGRPRGSRNKLGEAFIAALAEDFAKHGPAVIEKVRTDKPEAYLKIVASLLPRDLNLNVNKLDDLTDEQLLARLRQLTEQAAPLLANLDDTDGEGEGEVKAPRH
jgi:hypothetical protein